MALVLRQKAVVAQTPAVRDFLNTITKPTADLVTKVSPESPAALDKLEKTLAGAEQWSAELTRVDPLYQQFLQINPANGAKISEVMAFCLQQAGTGAFDKAVVGLQKLEPILQAAAKSTENAPKSTTTGPPPEFAEKWKTAREAWQDAVDEVNNQLEKLRVKLLNETDPEVEPLKEQLKQIGEVGLNAITANQRTALQAAIMDVDRTSGPAQETAIGKAQVLVTAFRTHIATDARVAACDDNPWEVPVSIRTTFGTALRELASVLTLGQKSG